MFWLSASSGSHQSLLRQRTSCGSHQSLLRQHTSCGHQLSMFWLSASSGSHQSLLRQRTSCGSHQSLLRQHTSCGHQLSMFWLSASSGSHQSLLRQSPVPAPAVTSPCSGSARPAASLVSYIAVLLTSQSYLWSRSRRRGSSNNRLSLSGTRNCITSWTRISVEVGASKQARNLPCDNKQVKPASEIKCEKYRLTFTQYHH
ncbi:uncharacterized protein LOC144055184 [Vanacampus margaritifer]